MKRRHRRHLPHQQRQRRFGLGHAAHRDGHAAVHDGVGEREQRAELEHAGAGARDDEHAEKAAGEGGAAPRVGLFLEKQDGDQRGEQRRREADRCRGRQRHQMQGQHGEGLRDRLREPARDVVAGAARDEDGKASRRQHDRGAENERRGRAEEHHFADGIRRRQQLGDRVRGGEHQGRADHAGDAERDVVGPQLRRRRQRLRRASWRRSAHE